MRPKNEIEEQMKEYGFSIYAYYGDGTMHYLDKDGINVIIQWTEEETFEIKYKVPCSIMYITTGKCSPFHKKSHFEKLLNKMKHTVYKLGVDN